MTTASEKTTARVIATYGPGGRVLSTLVVTTVRSAPGQPTVATEGRACLGRWANRRLALEAGAAYAEQINRAGFVPSALAEALGL